MAGIVVFLSIPTWKILHGKALSNDSTPLSQITLFIPESGTSKAQLAIEAFAQPARAASDITGPPLDTKLYVYRSSAHTAHQLPAYISARGAIVPVLSDCFGSVKISNTVAANDLPVTIATSPAIDPSDTTIYRVDTDGFTCALPEDLVWQSSGSSHTMIAPFTEITTYGDLPNSTGAPVPDACASTSINYDNGIAISSEYPVPNNLPENSNPNTGEKVPQVLWNNCMTTREPPSGRPLTFGADVRTTILDLDAQDQENGNLFLGGIYLALLGALIIELIGNGFEIVEGRAKKRKAGPTVLSRMKSWWSRVRRRVRRLWRKEPEQLPLWD